MKEENYVSSVERLKSKKGKSVCSNCKVLKRKCLIGQEVCYIMPKQVSNESNNLHAITFAQVGCKVMAQGPYWSSKGQGKVATVVEASDLDAVTVRWEEERHNSAGGGRASQKAGSVVKYELFSKQQGGVHHEQGRFLFVFACTQQ